MKTYRGSCHCGKVRFEVDADLDHVRVCDCSICRKRGALTHRVEESRFRLLTPLGELSVYQWHTRTARDYFCPACGVLPFRRPRTAPHLWLSTFDAWTTSISRRSRCGRCTGAVWTEPRRRNLGSGIPGKRTSPAGDAPAGLVSATRPRSYGTRRSSAATGSAAAPSASVATNRSV